MRLLLDQNLSFKLVARLADLYPGSAHARLLGLDQASDRALWDHARAAGLVLLSHDADFAEMAALHGPPPKVIWLRGGNRPTPAVEALLRRHAPILRAFGDDPDAACLELG